ncbi:hypothetical protein CFC21_064009 [Triticum aestivum]|uniref:Uncharacterized protein n=2 Tax=Triticum aestivum TaxID=4565 RepID=A0A9R1KJQ8_WHEAT|nr:hypothetical protein CFC21_064009 [Triticum aestivum]
MQGLPCLDLHLDCLQRIKRWSLLQKGLCGYMRSTEEYRAQLSDQIVADPVAAPHQPAAYMHRRARSGEPMEEWRRGCELARNGRVEQQAWSGHARVNTGGAAVATSRSECLS